MRILWVGDALVPTGFARVTHAVCDRLHERGHDVAVLGINHRGDPHRNPYRIYPASYNVERPHGEERLAEVIENEWPDVVLCLNDVWQLAAYADAVKDLRSQQRFRFMAYSPMDSGPLPRGLKPAFDAFDAMASYTNVGYRAMRASGYAKQLSIIPHGVDTDDFFPVDKADARAKLGIPAEAFVVLNANRNQPRKRIDLTIRGFMEFAQRVAPRPVVLYLHMGTKDMGWQTELLFARIREECGARNAIIAQAKRFKDLPTVSIEDLRAVYSAADVNINTCDSEGWGLIAFESAACRVPQIQPSHSACGELWRDHGYLMPVKMWLDDPATGMPRGLIDPVALGEQLAMLAQDSDIRQKLADDAYAYATDPRFSWDAIATQFEGMLSS